LLALLLIGGVNLVNLLLIRANGRAKEYAVRQALGAGRRHLLIETLLETVVLSLGGGLIGVLSGSFAIDLLAHLGSDRLPLGSAIAFDGRIAFVALLASLVTGVLLAVPIVIFNLHNRLAPSSNRNRAAARSVAPCSGYATGSSSHRFRSPSCCSREPACSG